MHEEIDDKNERMHEWTDEWMNEWINQSISYGVSEPTNHMKYNLTNCNGMEWDPMKPN